jgi:predicted nucleotidyltransferase
MISQADVSNTVERIVALYDPDRIYVFGSYAKDSLRETSDLDLLIVGPSDLPPRHRGQDVVAVLRGTAIEFDLLFVTPEELAAELSDPYSLLSTVMSSAKTLYERES